MKSHKEFGLDRKIFFVSLFFCLFFALANCQRPEKKNYRGNGSTGTEPATSEDEDGEESLDLANFIDSSSPTEDDEIFAEVSTAAANRPQTATTGSSPKPFLSGLLRRTDVTPVRACSGILVREDQVLVSRVCLQSIAESTPQLNFSIRKLEFGAFGTSESGIPQTYRSLVSRRIPFKNKLDLLELKDPFDLFSLKSEFGKFPDNFASTANCNSLLSSSSQNPTPQKIRMRSTAWENKDTISCSFSNTSPLAKMSSFKFSPDGLGQLILSTDSPRTSGSVLTPVMGSDTQPWAFGLLTESESGNFAHLCGKAKDSIASYLRYKPLNNLPTSFAKKNSCNDLSITLDQTPRPASKAALTTKMTLGMSAGNPVTIRAVSIKHYGQPIVDYTNCNDQTLSKGSSRCTIENVNFPALTAEGVSANSAVFVFYTEEINGQAPIKFRKYILIERKPTAAIPRLSISQPTSTTIKYGETKTVYYTIVNEGEDRAINFRTVNISTSAGSQIAKNDSKSTCQDTLSHMSGSNSCLLAFDVTWTGDNQTSNLSFNVNYADTESPTTPTSAQVRTDFMSEARSSGIFADFIPATGEIPVTGSYSVTIRVRNFGGKPVSIVSQNILYDLNDTRMTPTQMSTLINGTTDGCKTNTPLGPRSTCDVKVTLKWPGDNQKISVNFSLSAQMEATPLSAQVRGTFTGAAALQWGSDPKTVIVAYPWRSTTIAIPITNKSQASLNLSEISIVNQSMGTSGGPKLISHNCSLLAANQTCNLSVSIPAWSDPAKTPNNRNSQSYSISLKINSLSPVTRAYSYTLASLNLTTLASFLSLKADQGNVTIPLGSSVRFNVTATNSAPATNNISFSTISGTLNDPSLSLTPCAQTTLTSGASCNFSFTVPWTNTTTAKSIVLSVDSKVNVGPESYNVPQTIAFSVGSRSADQSFSWSANNLEVSPYPNGPSNLSVTLKNIGGVPIALTGRSLKNAPGGVSFSGCDPQTLNNSGTCNFIIPVQWSAPDGSSPRTFTLEANVRSTAGTDQGAIISKSFTYTVKPSNLSLQIAFDNPNTEAVNSLTGFRFKVTNVGNVPAQLNSISSNSGVTVNLDCAIIDPGGSCSGTAQMQDLGYWQERYWTEQKMPVSLNFFWAGDGSSKNVYGEKKVTLSGPKASMELLKAENRYQCDGGGGLLYSTFVEMVNNGSQMPSSLRYFIALDSDSNQRWEATPVSGNDPCASTAPGGKCSVELRLNDGNGLGILANKGISLYLNYYNGKDDSSTSVDMREITFPLSVIPDEDFTQEIGLNSYAPTIKLSNGSDCTINTGDVSLAEWVYAVDENTGDEFWNTRPPLEGLYLGGGTTISPGEEKTVTLINNGELSPDFSKVRFEVFGFMNGARVAAARSRPSIGIKRAAPQASSNAGLTANVSRPAGSVFLQSLDSPAIGIQVAQPDVVVPPEGTSFPVTLIAEGDALSGRMRSIQTIPLTDAIDTFRVYGRLDNNGCQDTVLKHPSMTRVDAPTTCSYRVILDYLYEFGGITRPTVLEVKFQDEAFNWHSYKANINLVFTQRSDRITLKRLQPTDPIALVSEYPTEFQFFISNPMGVTIYPREHFLGGVTEPLWQCPQLTPGQGCTVKLNYRDYSNSVRTSTVQYRVRYEVDEGWGGRLSFDSDLLPVEYTISPRSENYIDAEVGICFRSRRVLKIDRSRQMKFIFRGDGVLEQRNQIFVDRACRRPVSKSQSVAFQPQEDDLFSSEIPDLSDPLINKSRYSLNNRREWNPGSKDIVYDLDITWNPPDNDAPEQTYRMKELLLFKENGEVRMTTGYCENLGNKECNIGWAERNTERPPLEALFDLRRSLVLTSIKPVTGSN
jgi:hypothetical protein